MIINIKSSKPYDIYIGRVNKTYGLEESIWANPFVIGKDGDRDEVILKYRLWLNTRPDLLLRLNELKGKTLACWCHEDQNCHGRVLEELASLKNISNWFSNMLRLDERYIYQKIEYKTSENFYQAMKMPKNRIDLRAEIAAMPPFESKKQIRNKEKYPWRADWNDELKLKVMNHILRVKFRADTNWGRKLLLTEDWEIIEWNTWNDLFWGKDINTKQGKNYLGRILMDIREELRNG